MNICHPKNNIDALNRFFSGEGELDKNISFPRSFVTEEGVEARTSLPTLHRRTEYQEIEHTTFVYLPVGGRLENNVSLLRFSITPVVGVSTLISPPDSGHITGQKGGESLKFSTASETADNLNKQLQMVYALERAKHHRAASKVILRYIELNFTNSNLAGVNCILREANLEELSKWSITSLVRFTASAKSHLPAWSTVYRKAKTVLEKKGENAEKLLIGIKE